METGRNRMGTMGNGRKRMEHNGKGEERSRTGKSRMGEGEKYRAKKGEIMTAVYAET